MVPRLSHESPPIAGAATRVIRPLRCREQVVALGDLGAIEALLWVEFGQSAVRCFDWKSDTQPMVGVGLVADLRKVRLRAPAALAT